MQHHPDSSRILEHARLSLPPSLPPETPATISAWQRAHIALLLNCDNWDERRMGAVASCTVAHATSGAFLTIPAPVLS
jgi:hypothetical protein